MLRHECSLGFACYSDGCTPCLFSVHIMLCKCAAAEGGRSQAETSLYIGGNISGCGVCKGSELALYRMQLLQHCQPYGCCQPHNTTHMHSFSLMRYCRCGSSMRVSDHPGCWQQWVLPLDCCRLSALSRLQMLPHPLYTHACIAAPPPPPKPPMPAGVVQA